MTRSSFQRIPRHHFENPSDTDETWILWIYGNVEAKGTNMETGETSRVDTEDELAGTRPSETMVHEIAEIEVIPGHEADFEAAVAAAAPYFRSAQGARTLTLVRSVEFPTRYRLIVGWDTVEDHVVAFRGSPGFSEWRRLAGPHFAAPPEVEHVRDVLTAF